MKSEHLVGTNIPRFTYDTPTVPENDFYALCEGSRPLCMIFLPGFDHPVSREYITRYLKTLPALKGARLACVVRSSAKAVPRPPAGRSFPSRSSATGRACCTAIWAWSRPAAC